MTMKLMQLRTHWNADDAYAVISFLDELRDMLWATYGDDIIAMQRDAATPHADDADACDINDNIPF